MEIHHVGYLTKDMDLTREQFLAMGFQIEHERAYDNLRDINIEFLKNGPYRIELIEPAGTESPMYPLLKKYKNTPYHLCYITDRLDSKIAELETAGYRTIQAPMEAPCIENGVVSFLLHPDMGIIELLEIGGGGYQSK